ncbi:MAG: hypothetical protein Q9184_008412 [Pyrenodesmia sp. 2 TL-2023]
MDDKELIELIASMDDGSKNVANHGQRDRMTYFNIAVVVAVIGITVVAVLKAYKRTVSTAVNYCVHDLDDPAIWTILRSPLPESQTLFDTILNMRDDLSFAPSEPDSQLMLSRSIQSLYESTRGLACARAPVSDKAVVPSTESQEGIENAREFTEEALSLVHQRRRASYLLKRCLDAQEQEVRQLPFIARKPGNPMLDLAKWNLYIFQAIGFDTRKRILEPRLEQQKALGIISSARDKLHRDEKRLEEFENALQKVHRKLESPFSADEPRSGWLNRGKSA